MYVFVFPFYSLVPIHILKPFAGVIGAPNVAKIVVWISPATKFLRSFMWESL